MLTTVVAAGKFDVAAFVRTHETAHIGVDAVMPSSMPTCAEVLSAA